MERIATTLERLAEDYATVHADQLTAARTPPPLADKGKVWVQSDYELWQAEQIKKADEIKWANEN